MRIRIRGHRPPTEKRALYIAYLIGALAGLACGLLTGWIFSGAPAVGSLLIGVFTGAAAVTLFIIAGLIITFSDGEHSDDEDDYHPSRHYRGKP